MARPRKYTDEQFQAAYYSSSTAAEVKAKLGIGHKTYLSYCSKLGVLKEPPRVSPWEVMDKFATMKSIDPLWDTVRQLMLKAGLFDLAKAPLWRFSVEHLRGTWLAFLKWQSDPDWRPDTEYMLASKRIIEREYGGTETWVSFNSFYNHLRYLSRQQESYQALAETILQPPKAHKLTSDRIGDIVEL